MKGSEKFRGEGLALTTIMSARLYLGCVCSVALLACAAVSTPDQSDESAATAGHFVQANSKFFWAESSYEEFLKIQASQQQVLPASLDDNDPLTVRLQAIIDRFDAVVRQDMTTRFNAPLVAPKPIVKVLPSGSLFNAWMSGTLGRVGDGPADHPVAASGGQADSGAVAVPPAGGGVSLALAQENEIDQMSAVEVSTPPGWRDVSAFATLWNGARARCQVDATRDSSGTTLTFSGAECLNSGAYTNSVAIVASSPFIHVSSDLIAALDEGTMQFVLAHELTHYYRSHSSPLVTRKYGFWYDEDPSQPLRPVPTGDAAALQAAYIEISASPKPVAGLTLQSHYSPRMRRLLVQLGAVLDSLGSANQQAPCYPASKALNDGTFWSTQLLMNGSVPTEAVKASYLAYEAAVVACASSITLGANYARDQLPMAWLEGLQDYRLFAAANIKGQTTLGGALSVLNDLATKVDGKVQSFLSGARENHIGFYTVEQEADEVALQITTEAGMAPEDVIKAWSNFMSAEDAVLASSMSVADLASYRAQSGAIDAPTCSALLAAEFTTSDAQGQKVPFTVSLGDVDEPHHSSCYRMYNLWREQRAHQYVAAPAPAALTPPWSELKAAAQRITAAAAAAEAAAANNPPAGSNPTPNPPPGDAGAPNPPTP